MINKILKESQIKNHLEKYKAFQTGCNNLGISEQDLNNAVYIGSTNPLHEIFLKYNLKKYNIDIDNIEKLPNKPNKCVCNTTLKYFFYLYNEDKKLLYVIGSECIKNFTKIKIKLCCLYCKRDNATGLSENGICCKCQKFVCHICYDNLIYKHNMCKSCIKGKCETCLKKIDQKYKFCYKHNIENKKLCIMCNKNYHDKKFNSCWNCKY